MFFQELNGEKQLLFFKNKILEAVECGPGKALTNMFKRFEFQIKCLKLDNLEDIRNYE